MNKLPLIFAMSVLTSACAAFQTTSAGQTTDPNGLVNAAQNFSNTLFAEEQPAITTAVAHLPAETQALAQAAYAALQKGISQALAKGVTDLSSVDQVKAQSALVALSNATDALHDALHSANDPVLAPVVPQNPGSVLPGVSAVPTIKAPTTP